MVRVLSFSFEQYFNQFTMLLVEGSCETSFLRHLSNDVFWTLKFENTSGRRFIFFLKIFKIEFKFTKWKKKITNYFCF